jgi:flagellar hook-basal body complex protein FliE
MVAPFAAAKAYAAIQAQAANLSQAAGALGSAGQTSQVHGFEEILKSAMGDAVQASRNAEIQMKAQVQGKADLVDVVTAISSAQTSLQTVLAVRDQVISAYQQIMQMSI